MAEAVVAELVEVAATTQPMTVATTSVTQTTTTSLVKSADDGLLRPESIHQTRNRTTVCIGCTGCGDKKKVKCLSNIMMTWMWANQFELYSKLNIVLLKFWTSVWFGDLYSQSKSDNVSGPYIIWRTYIIFVSVLLSVLCLSKRYPTSREIRIFSFIIIKIVCFRT